VFGIYKTQAMFPVLPPIAEKSPYGVSTVILTATESFLRLFQV
jgi:hypothetical protein